MSHFRKWALLLLSVLCVLPVLLCACAGDTDLGTETGASAQTGDPSIGGSVTVGIAQDLDSLDPHRALSAGTSEVLFNLFEGLLKVSPDGGVVPAVASDYTISEDKTTYTFTLRQGVQFHSGEPVTAEDVVYSLQRCAGSENDGTPLITAFSVVSEISAPDAEHVTVKLKEPMLEFLYSLTAAIIPKDSGAQMATQPVGTGPFRFVSYAPQQSLVIARFDDYWGDGAYLDTVTFRIIQNTQTLVMGLQGGSLDMVIHLPNTAAGQLSDEFTTYQDTMKLVQALYLNNAVAPLNDVRVRQALCYATDVPQIIDFVCNGAGVATGTSMYPAFTRYFLPELAEAYPTNVEKAKQLLAEAGYPDGFALTITVPSNYAQHVQTAEVLEQQLGSIGVRVRIEPVEWETWVSDVYRGRSYMATVCGIAASDMTAREMLIRYTSDNGKNFINFENAAYDDAVSRALSATDENVQTEAYLEAERILSEEAASVFLQDLCDLVATRSDLGGLTFYRTYVLDMRTIYFVA